MKNAKPLFLKLIIIIPLITTAFWLVSTLIANKLFYNSVLSAFTKNNTLYISALGKQLINDFKYGDYYQIRRVVNEAYNPDYMQYFAFYTSELKPIAISPEQISGSKLILMEEKLANMREKPSDEHFFKKDGYARYHFQTQIVDEDGKLIGFLVMGGTTQHLGSIVKKQILSFSILGLFVLTAQILAIIYVSHIITRPLSEVTDLLKRAEQEDPDNLIDTALEATAPKSASRETALFLSVYQKLLRKIQEHIQYKKEMALHAAVGRMATHVAHDIRSPLSSVGRFLALNLQLDGETGQLREAAKKSVEKLIHMSEDLVDYAKAGEIHAQPTNIYSTIKEVVDEVNHLAVAKKIKIEVNCPDHLRANMDQHKFNRVISNMVINSIQAIPIGKDGGKIAITADIKNAELLITVSDTGIGIAKENLPYVFDSSFTFGKPSGSGLGLSFCKNVIDAHGGKIEIESEPEKGTKFTIRVPLSAAEKYISTQSAPSGKPQISQTTHGSSTVLVVDDDPEIRKKWKEIITRQTGVGPIEMQNGEDLLNSSIDFSKIRIGISDYKFENCALDGIDILQHMKRKNVSVLVLCTSMSENPAVRKAAEHLGVKHILPKPIPEELVKKMF